MQRAIFVPSNLLSDDGQLPDEALRLAATSHLQVVISHDGGNEIRIETIPHEKGMYCDSIVKAGFAHTIQIVDEFITFDKTYVIEFISPSGDVSMSKPRVNERHKLFFVQRFAELGTYQYSVFSFNIMDTRESRSIYCAGTFEVI